MDWVHFSLLPLPPPSTDWKDSFLSLTPMSWTWFIIVPITLDMFIYLCHLFAMLWEIERFILFPEILPVEHILGPPPEPIPAVFSANLSWLCSRRPGFRYSLARVETVTFCKWFSPLEHLLEKKFLSEKVAGEVQRKLRLLLCIWLTRVQFNPWHCICFSNTARGHIWAQIQK